MADLEGGFSIISLSLGTIGFFITDLNKFNFSSVFGICLETLLFSDKLLKKYLTILSSIEWKLITIIFPPNLFFKKEFKDPHCGFKVIDENGKIAFGANSYGLKHSHGEVKIGQTIQFEFSIMQKFANGKYSLTIGLVNSGHGSSGGAVVSRSALKKRMFE